MFAPGVRFFPFEYKQLDDDDKEDQQIVDTVREKIIRQNLEYLSAIDLHTKFIREKQELTQAYEHFMIKECEQLNTKFKDLEYQVQLRIEKAPKVWESGSFNHLFKTKVDIETYDNRSCFLKAADITDELLLTIKLINNKVNDLETKIMELKK